MADTSADSNWLKCTDGVSRRPGDYPGQVLPFPPLAVQPVTRRPAFTIADEDLIVTRDRHFGTGLDTWEF